MTGLTRTDWQTISIRIREGKFTPIISDRVSSQFLAGYQTFIQAWAEDLNYPFGTSSSITRLAQFYKVTAKDDLVAKEGFVDFSKKHYIRSTSPLGSDEQQSKRSHKELFSTRYTDLISQHNFAKHQEPIVPPLSLLAKLPLPIYITTSHFNFLELALKLAGKQPRVDICYWRDELYAPTQEKTVLNPLITLRELLSTRFNEEELRTLCYDLSVDYDSLPGRGNAAKARELIAYLERYERLPDLKHLGRLKRPDISWDDYFANNADSLQGPYLGDKQASVFSKEPDYRPTVQEPLVYHLHGLDLLPASMVLTEDDYLDFLVRVSWDKNVIPPRVAQALADSSLLLLGYRLQDWDFRVLFRGLITAKQAPRRRSNFSIQLTPEQEAEEQITSVADARDFLEDYFSLGNFTIYWGDAKSFTEELWDQWAS